MFKGSLWAFLALTLMTSLAAAEEGDLREGKQIFEQFCTACHGLEATGHGPMVTVLTLPPADLTRLSVENGGAFPLIRVIKRIDGRDPLVSHGSPMPVYGDFFEGKDVMMKADSGQPIATSQPVADLVAYLRSLQTHTD